MVNQVQTPATEALLGEAARDSAGTLLVPGGQAALAVGLAIGHPEATVRWQPVDVREREGMVRFPGNLGIDEPGDHGGPVGAVVMAVPPDRDLARRWILMAETALEPGGHFYLAGANAEGIRSVIADAGEVFGPPTREDYRSKGRIARFRRDDATRDRPAWASEPGIAPGTWREIVADPVDVTGPLVTQAGVFAGGRIDAGTRLVLGALPDRVAGTVLDVGCGAGAIGVVAARRGAGSVDLTDVNLLAIQAATENIRRLQLDGCRAVPGDVYAAAVGRRYDLIVSNPPFHRGKAIDFTVADRLIAEAPAHLEPGGGLLVVANAFLAYGKRMEPVFARIETVAATRQYHVLRASAPR